MGRRAGPTRWSGCCEGERQLLRPLQQLRQLGDAGARASSPPFWGLRTNYSSDSKREDGGPGGDGSAGALIAKAARGIASWGCLGHKERGLGVQPFRRGPVWPMLLATAPLCSRGSRAASYLQSMC